MGREHATTRSTRLEFSDPLKGQLGERGTKAAIVLTAGGDVSIGAITAGGVAGGVEGDVTVTAGGSVTDANDDEAEGEVDDDEVE